MPGSLSHLSRRFFDVLLSRPLAATEIAAVRTWLHGPEAEIFFGQPHADQRHGYHAALTVIAAGDADVSVIRAALLHDIGKRHAGLGLIGRSLSSMLIRSGLPLTTRAKLYRDHGEIAAGELTELACEPLVIEFARHHHGERPTAITPTSWDLLQLADQPPKTRYPAGF